MKFIGLTGNIACGKSTISNILKKNNIPVIDADAISRQVVVKGEKGLKLVIEQFGDKYLNKDGNLNRKKLADVIFADKKQRILLERIIHPLVAKKVQEKIENYRQKGEKIVIYEVPLLFEANLQKKVDDIILVYVDLGVQLSRLIKRDKLTLTEAKKRIDSQMSQHDKVQLSTYIINNSGDIDESIVQLKTIWKQIDVDGNFPLVINK